MIEDLKKSHQQDKEHLESEYKKTIKENHSRRILTTEA